MQPTLHTPSLFVIAAFSRFPEAFEWSKQRVVNEWGPLALESPLLPFDQTSYYQSSMGGDLQKQLWAFEKLVDPAELSDRKILTHQWELELVQERPWSVSRPVNLDPGYLTEAKLVLATTKDRDHRIYLRDGIYAEGTLYYHKGGWRNRPWTYPDFQSEPYHTFFLRCREYLRSV